MLHAKSTIPTVQIFMVIGINVYITNAHVHSSYSTLSLIRIF
jgi:hypothetical protein